MTKATKVIGPSDLDLHRHEVQRAGRAMKHLGRGGVGQQLMAAQAVLLLHAVAEDLLQAASHHRDSRHHGSHHVVVHLQVSHSPAPGSRTITSSIPCSSGGK